MTAYDPYQCEAFTHNMDAPFTVLAGGEHRLTLNLAPCDGQVTNYQVTLINIANRHQSPASKVRVIDAKTGAQVGTVSPSGELVSIGHVPPDAVYTVIVTNDSKKDERLTLYFSGAIGGQS